LQEVNLWQHLFHLLEIRRAIPTIRWRALLPPWLCLKIGASATNLLFRLKNDVRELVVLSSQPTPMQEKSCATTRHSPGNEN
jgi:hypothetical protein